MMNFKDLYRIWFYHYALQVLFLRPQPTKGCGPRTVQLHNMPPGIRRREKFGYSDRHRLKSVGHDP